MLTELRRDLNGRLAALPQTRRPSLRRAPDEGWLFSSDAPRVTDAAALRSLLEELSAEGWRWELRDGLLWLDHAIPMPEPAPVGALPPGEVGCAVSLLRRHPGGPSDEAAARAIAKAADEGAPALERACRKLHLAWAGYLREGRTLPSALLPLAEEAWRQVSARSDRTRSG